MVLFQVKPILTCALTAAVPIVSVAVTVHLEFCVTALWQLALPTVAENVGFCSAVLLIDGQGPRTHDQKYETGAIGVPVTTGFGLVVLATAPDAAAPLADPVTLLADTPMVE